MQTPRASLLSQHHRTVTVSIGMAVAGAACFVMKEEYKTMVSGIPKNIMASAAISVVSFGGATCSAMAEDPQSVRTSISAPIAYVADPDGAAREWRDDYRGGIAFAVYLGTTEEITPEQYQQGLTNVSTSAGASQTQFYFIQNDAPYTSFGLYYDDMVVGPIGTRDIVQKTKDAASYQVTNRRLFGVN